MPIPSIAAPTAYAPIAPAGATDVAALKEILALAKRGKTDAVDERKGALRDAGAQKLVEWTLLRSDSNEAGFARYARFVKDNPGWPSTGMLRRRAEGQLWQERRDGATVAAFFADQEPQTMRGRLAMARAFLANGDRASAQKFVRDAWRLDDCSADFEAQVLESFGELLSRADHKARMDRRLYAEDFETAMRAAQRLGGADVAIVKARMAVQKKADNAGAALEAVPNEARDDPSYIFGRAQWLRRADRIGEAAQLILSVPKLDGAIHDANEWWVERRLISRKLLDADNPQAAYRIARDAVVPGKDNYRVEAQFTAGWIALRFLNDPLTAQRHFAQMSQGISNPISLARAGYWQGRALEAAGRSGEARAQFEAAARYPTAYYGQLARMRIGRTDIAVRRPPEPSGAQRTALRNVDIVRAAELLYAAGERELMIPFVSDLSDKGHDPGALALIAELAAKNDDARATLQLGKSALAEGMSFDTHAFPTIGIPKFSLIGPEVDRSAVYAIARQESAFNPRAVSTAKAMGLMQVTPGAGKTIAKKFNVTFNAARLLSDPAYNAQMGAAEIGDLVRNYDDNYVLAFAAYNAGRGRVKEWLERFGDPRNPAVDPVDWVERIPFSETRNYVQRVMENMQVYRARFAGAARLQIDADLRGSRPQ
jgi:soluble lytic murein transglycosylase